MQIETRTALKWSKDMERAWIVLDMLLKPRGSGNRYFAKRLAATFKQDPELKPYITRVVVGSSRVTVRLRCEVGLMGAMMRVVNRHVEVRDVPGQMPMFA